MGKTGRANIRDAIRAAGRYGLWVLASGAGADLKYEFFDRKTGRAVLTYFAASKRWLRLQSPQAEGRASDLDAALDAAMSGRPA